MACLKRKYKNKYKKKFFQNPDDFKSLILKKINLIIQNKVKPQQKIGSKFYMDVTPRKFQNLVLITHACISSKQLGSRFGRFYLHILWQQYLFKKKIVFVFFSRKLYREFWIRHSALIQDRLQPVSVNTDNNHTDGLVTWSLGQNSSGPQCE